ncbi:tyrosine-type recombinase/integrase [Metabacillus dongyingensis]|uniref:tyrosine-type recombinase/integrase n=1 Tax=Metabacillus dongyingensis TaxID=2874282 RepID=UPI003B8AA109
MLIEMAVKEFIAEKKFEKLTENSLMNYNNFFKVWNEWLAQEGIKHINELSPKVNKQFLSYCQEVNGNKPKTVNTKLKLMRTFCKWLLEEQLTEVELCKGVKAQREEDNPKILSEQDLQAVLRHLRRSRRRENTFHSRRNYIIILALAGTGMRLHELTSLNWNDVDFESSLITIQTSKSRKRQSIPLSDTLSLELEDWKRYLEGELSKLPQAVFVSDKGKRLEDDSVQNVFKRLKKSVGIEGYFSPHVLRNFYIKQLLKGGANLREVQLLARHSKIEITKGYVGYFAHELKETLDDNNPLRGLL